MLEITDNSVVITDEAGKEDYWKIYFFYHNPERNKTFYFLYKESDPDSLIVMASADGKTLETVNEEEEKEAEEMLDVYDNDPEIAKIR